MILQLVEFFLHTFIGFIELLRETLYIVVVDRYDSCSGTWCVAVFCLAVEGDQLEQVAGAFFCGQEASDGIHRIRIMGIEIKRIRIGRSGHGDGIRLGIGW